MGRLIRICDTTLRDGTQGEGVSSSMEDKVRLAVRMDALGIHYIEGGWPGSNPGYAAGPPRVTLARSPPPGLDPRAATSSRGSRACRPRGER
jgi:hypothetical protein